MILFLRHTWTTHEHHNLPLNARIGRGWNNRAYDFVTERNDKPLLYGWVNFNISFRRIYQENICPLESILNMNSIYRVIFWIPRNSNVRECYDMIKFSWKVVPLSDGAVILPFWLKGRVDRFISELIVDRFTFN